MDHTACHLNEMFDNGAERKGREETEHPDDHDDKYEPDDE
jgi:hypothetical protein